MERYREREHIPYDTEWRGVLINIFLECYDVGENAESLHAFVISAFSILHFFSVWQQTASPSRRIEGFCHQMLFFYSLSKIILLQPFSGKQLPYTLNEKDIDTLNKGQHVSTIS